MLFAIPTSDRNQNWMHPITGRQFPITDANPKTELVALLPEGGYEVMPAPPSMGKETYRNQLDSNQWKEMTRGMDPRDASDQYAKYILTEMMPKS